MHRYTVPLVVVFSVLLSAGLLGSPKENPKSCGDAPAQLDEVLGVRSAPGAFVMSVDPGSPAEQVGLDVCDLVAGFNDQDFRSYGVPAAFAGAMREAAMFSGADLLVWRSSDSGQTYHQDRLKLRIPLQPGAKIGASVTFQVLVSSVVKDGSADVGGVRAGEFIDQVNGLKVSEMRSISDLDQRISAFAKQDGKVLLTLSQWKPVRGSTEYKTSFVTREVLVTLRQL